MKPRSGFVVKRDSHIILHTVGTPYERGVQHGTLLRHQVRGCFQEVYREGFFAGSPLLPAALWYGFAHLNSVFFSAAEKAELQGLADGAGMRYLDVLVMNSDPPYEAAYNLVFGGTVAACTQFVLRGTATTAGGTLLGRNLDMINLNRLHRYAMVQVQHPRQGYAFLTPGFAGKVLDAPTGWNEKGLVVCQDVAELPRENFLGLYSGAFVRRILERCATLQQATDMVRALPRLGGGGKNLAVADPHEAGAVEVAQTLWQGLGATKRLACRGFGEFGDAADSIVFTNHYRVLGPHPPSRSSAARERRARQLVAQYHGQIDADKLKAFLTDKLDPDSGKDGGPSDNIINWYGPRITEFAGFGVAPQVEVRMATTISTVCDLAAQVMWVALGESYVDRTECYFPLHVPTELGRL